MATRTHPSLSSPSAQFSSLCLQVQAPTLRSNIPHCHWAAEAANLKGSSAASATSSGLIMRSAGMSTCRISAEGQS